MTFIVDILVEESYNNFQMQNRQAPKIKNVEEKYMGPTEDSEFGPCSPLLLMEEQADSFF